MNTKCILKKVLVFLILLNGSAFSQEISLDSIESLTLDKLMSIKISSSSRVKQKVKEASSKIIVITRQQIKSRGYFCLMDVLRDMPYFQIQSEHGHWTKGGIVNVRGHRSGDSGNNKYLILIDGIRISDESAEGIFLGMNSVPLDMVKQIEINYGPNSTFYGRDAYAGLINIVTLKDKFTTFGIRGGSFNSRYIYSGFRKYFSSKIITQIMFSNYLSDEQDPTKKSITYRKRKNFPSAPYTGIFDRSSDNKYLNFSLTYKNFKLTYLIFRIKGSETYGSSPNLYACEYSTVTKQKNQIFNLEWNKKSNSIKQNIYMRYKIFEFDPQTANLYLDDLNRKPIFKDSVWIQDPLFAYGGRKYYYFRNRSIKTGAHYKNNIKKELSFIVGLDAAFIRGIPVISEGKGGNPFTTEHQKRNYEHFFSSIGLYLWLEQHISNKFRLNLGGRFDKNSHFADEFVPRLALLYTSSKNYLKLILSKGYLSPSITQKYFTSITNFSYISQNTHLQSEHNYSIELDYQKKINTGYWGVNLFYNKIKNIISESTITGDSTWVTIQTDSFYVPIYMSQNNTWGYRYGFSLYFNQSVSSNLFFHANYTYLTGKNKNKLGSYSLVDDMIARHSVQSGIQYMKKKYSLYWGVNYLSERKIITDYGDTDYSFLVDPNNRVHFKPQWFSTLSFRLTGLGKGITLYTRIKNLFNQKYYGQTISSSWGNPKILQDKIRIDAGIDYVF